MSTAIDLSIIIVNWNTRDLLAQCLESVGSGQSTESLISNLQSPTTEVIVIDNASSDDSVPLVRERFPWVQLIENRENVGFARANNQALQVATGRYLLLLNSDTVVHPGALQTLIETLKQHPEAGATGPQVLNPDGSLQNSYGSLPTEVDEIIGPYWADFFAKPWGGLGRRLWGQRLETNTPFAVDRVSFACTMIRRTALDQVGLLDETFEFYSEDYDWFKRLKDSGWIALFCPQAVVTHHWGASSRQRSEWSLHQLYRGKRRYFTKHYGINAERFLRLGVSLRFVAKIGAALVTCPKYRTNAVQQIALYRRLIQDMQRPL